LLWLKPLDYQDIYKTLENKPGISNLLDNTQALFDNINENIPIDTTNIVDNNNIDINIIENLSSPIISGDQIEVNLLDNKSINIDLKIIWQITKSIQITTTDNHHVIFNYSELIHGNFKIIWKIGKILPFENFL